MARTKTHPQVKAPWHPLTSSRAVSASRVGAVSRPRWRNRLHHTRSVARWRQNALPVTVTVSVGLAEEWKQRNGPETAHGERGTGRAVCVCMSRVGCLGDGVRREARHSSAIDGLARTATRIHPTHPAPSNHPVHPSRHSSAFIPLLSKTLPVPRSPFSMSRPNEESLDNPYLQV
jgi:hypothetical protein